MSETRPTGVSEREAEVLSALSGGLSNAQISNRLHISVRTVESHISSLLRKYGVADRWALAERAKQENDGSATASIALLPTARTSFVGRGRERDAVLAAFDKSRLVTVVGPGGVGKTRLAVVFAAEHESTPPGAFVDLVPVRDGFVAQAVAAALGVVERPQQPPEEAVIRKLGRGRSLLILDNCEHLIDEVAGFVDRVLSACPGVRFLVTSRERLALPGERTVPVPPLPLGSDAEALFFDRVRAADPEFSADPADVSRLCARLDGMPLAIELAAARSVSLGAEGLLAGLDDALGLLAGGRGPNERHRSLRAVIGWSYDLLDPDEQRLFRRLAVFVGGFDLDAAVAVTVAGDRAAVAGVLARLVDKSLVHRLSGAASRYRMLDTIRAFAVARPDADGERAGARDRHLRWASDTAVRLAGRMPYDWRPEFDLVADDLRTASRSADDGPCSPAAHQLARALGRLTFARRFLAESLGHFQRAAARAPGPGAAARDLRDAAGCAHFVTGAGGRAMRLLLASAEQARLAGDGDGQAVALARAVEVAARYSGGFPEEVAQDELFGLLERATAAGSQANPVVAAGIAQAMAWTAVPEKMGLDPVRAEAAVAAARATADPLLLNASLDALRVVANNAGRLREAHRISLERLDLVRLMDRDDPRAAVEIEDTYDMACMDAVAAGDLPAALDLARQVVRDDLVGNDPYLIASKIIPVLVLTGTVDEALRYASPMWDAWERAQSPAAGWLSPTVSAVALAYGLRGEDRDYRLWRARAVEVAGDAATYRARHLAAFGAFVDARVAVHHGRLTHADDMVNGVFRGFPHGWYETYAQAAGAELAVVAGLPDRAARLSAAASAGAENAWAAACLARATGRLHGDQDALRASVAAWERIDARFERACTLLLLPNRAAEGEAELAELGLRTPASWHAM